jgi:hypothetical protein
MRILLVAILSLMCSISWAGETWIDGESNEGHQIQDEGVKIPQQPIMDFVGAGVTAANSGSKTVVTIGGAVSDTAYNATSWDNVTDVAPSKNAIRDKIEALVLGGGEATTVADTATIDMTLGGTEVKGDVLTVPVVDASSDTTMFLGLFGSATGNLAPMTDSGIIYNANTKTLELVSSGTSPNYLGNSLGLGVASPTAVVHIKAGTATAGTAPIKLTAGTNLTTPESGTFEYDGTNLYFTP